MSSPSAAERVGPPAAGRWRQILAALAPFGRRHLRHLVAGSITALLVVGIRLILPWPLRALMNPWLGKTSVRGAGMLYLVPSWCDPTFAMGGIFFVLILLLGLADYFERLCFARFAIGSIRDLRARAVKIALGNRRSAESPPAGDLIARLIGDTARIKAGLKGFLVHVATNGVMCAGVAIVLLTIDLALGMIFLAAALLVVLVTAIGAKKMYARALRYRTKEGQLAECIAASSATPGGGGEFTAANRKSGRHEAALTRIQGLTTWSAHILLGTAVVAILFLGVRAVTAERLGAGDLFVVMMYILMIRAPIVKLTRQGARTGKILACGERLAHLLEVAEGSAPERSELAPLRHELRLSGVCVAARGAGRWRRRLGPLNLRIGARQRVALVGGPGAGKTTLLEALAGLHELRAGRISWDSRDLSGALALRTSAPLAYIGQEPAWPREPVRDLFNLPAGVADADALDQLRPFGVPALLKRLRVGVDACIPAGNLSPGERRGFALARLIRTEASVWLLDDPFCSLDKRRARKAVRRILAEASEATVIAAFGRPVGLRAFDRVIELRRGRIVFDGSPQAWRARRERRGAPAAGEAGGEGASR